MHIKNDISTVILILVWVSMDKKNQRILILDDDLDNLQLTKDMLQFGGFETNDFLNPQLALDLFKQNPQPI